MKDRIDKVMQQNIDSFDAIYLFRRSMQLAVVASKMHQQWLITEVTKIQNVRNDFFVLHK